MCIRDRDNDSANIKGNFDALEGRQVAIAGRLMSRRGMGKVSFCDLQDKSGRIQLYACLLYTSRCVQETGHRYRQ